MITVDDVLGVELLLRDGRFGSAIKCVRVSSAQARGRAKQYAYWGVARYEVRLGAGGTLVATCVRRASSDRRSYRLAQNDALKSGLPMITSIGRLRKQDATTIIAWAIGRLDEQSVSDMIAGNDDSAAAAE